MIAALELPVVEAAIGGQDHDVTHYICCDPDLARCGKDVTTEPWTTSGENVCEICDNKDRLRQPCQDPDCPIRSL